MQPPPPGTPGNRQPDAGPFGPLCAWFSAPRSRLAGDAPGRPLQGGVSATARPVLHGRCWSWAAMTDDHGPGGFLSLPVSICRLWVRARGVGGAPLRRRGVLAGCGASRPAEAPPHVCCHLRGPSPGCASVHVSSPMRMAVLDWDPTMWPCLVPVSSIKTSLQRGSRSEVLGLGLPQELGGSHFNP